MVRPKAYLRRVVVREKTMRVLEHASSQPKAMIAGASLGYAADHIIKARSGGKIAFTGATLGLTIARIAGDLHWKLGLKTVAEVSGRPVLARRVAEKFAKNNLIMYESIIDWGNHGPRMNAAERLHFRKQYKDHIGIPGDLLRRAHRQKVNGKKR